MKSKPQTDRETKSKNKIAHRSKQPRKFTWEGFRAVQENFQAIKWLVLPGLVTIALVVGARSLGAFQFLELASLDAGLRLRPQENPDRRILIISLTETDIQQLGQKKQYPVPDQMLAKFLHQLQAFRPRAIGLDLWRDYPIEPGHDLFLKTLRSMPNVIAIENVIPNQGKSIAAPDIPSEQVGFVDIPPDIDGRFRRSLLGTHNPQNHEYHFSLALRLAEHYLKAEQIHLGNGRQNRSNMRFGDTELFQFDPNAGGYVQADKGGNQILLNFRHNRQPFERISFQTVQRGEISPEQIRDRVVLIGTMASSVKDLFPVNSVLSHQDGQISGVEYHAHAVSQILSAVLDHRPLLRTWHPGWEFLWLIGWGSLGLLITWKTRSPIVLIAAVIGSTGLLLGLSYGLLVSGWWVPIVPSILVLGFNQLGVSALYRYERSRQEKINDRRVWLEEIFVDIHNQPIQRLKKLLSDYASLDLQQIHLDLLQRTPTELQAMHQELESIRTMTINAVINDIPPPLFVQDHVINLSQALHEALHETYHATLKTPLPNFQSIQVKIVSFEEMPDESISPKLKRQLCQFLQEALCNVGKHAIGVTRLTIRCAPDQKDYVIRIEDNGQSNLNKPQNGQLENLKTRDRAHPRKGLGTKQAQQLAQKLPRGQFQRCDHKPQGIICELRWTIR